MSVYIAAPTGLTFQRWASLLKEELSAYNVPNPGTEGSWLEWAQQVFAVPELTGLGLADPRGFRSWQDWASSLLQVST